ncbi:MAG: CPBP family intramembrane glutamic endopeptidase [Christensenellaceae bacterium]
MESLVFKKKLRRDATIQSLLLLMLTVGGMFGAMPAVWIFDFFGVDTEFQEFIVSSYFNVIYELIFLGVAYLIYKYRFADFFARPKTTVKFSVYTVLGVLGAASVGLLIFFVYNLLFSVGGMEVLAPEFTEGITNPTYLVLINLYICLFGPILEEIVFRGVILGTLKKYGNLFAILFSSILFAMFHMNAGQLPVPLLTGLILGYATIKSGSIIPAIIAHIVNNSFNTLAVELFDIPVVSAVGNIVYFVCIAAFVMMLVKLVKDARTWRGYNDLMSTGKMMGISALSFGFILYFVFYASALYLFSFAAV